MCLIAFVYSIAIPVLLFLRFCHVLRGFRWGELGACCLAMGRFRVPGCVGVSPIGLARAMRASFERVAMMSFIALLYSVPSWVLFLRRFRFALVEWRAGRVAAAPVMSGFVGVLVCCCCSGWCGGLAWCGVSHSGVARAIRVALVRAGIMIFVIALV